MMGSIAMLREDLGSHAIELAGRDTRLRVPLERFECETDDVARRLQPVPFSVGCDRHRSMCAATLLGVALTTAVSAGQTITCPADDGEIDRIVFPGGAPNLSAEMLKSRALFIVARDDANDAGLRLPIIRVNTKGRLCPNS